MCVFKNKNFVIVRVIISLTSHKGIEAFPESEYTLQYLVQFLDYRFYISAGTALLALFSEIKAVAALSYVL